MKFFCKFCYILMVIAVAPSKVVGEKSLLNNARNQRGLEVKKIFKYGSHVLENPSAIGGGIGEILQLTKSDHHVPCLPPVNSNKKHFILAYGPLMQEAYRLAINPAISSVFPVGVNGYSRFWGSRIASVALGGTFLALEEDQGSVINAVMFSLNSSAGFAIYENTTLEKDAYGFCRQKLHQNKITILGGEGTLDHSAEYWIYVSKPENILAPDKLNPVILSYVDVFLEGCMEIQLIYGLLDFVQNCITSTKGWTSFWVNDRIYPRRPFLYSPFADVFDTALKKLVPEAFNGIVIE